VKLRKRTGSSGSVAEVIAEWQRLVGRGRTREAEKLCRAALKRFPDSAVLLLITAPVISDVEEEKSLVRRAVALEPTNAEALVMAATSMFHVHDLDQASEYLARAAALVPAGWEHEGDLLYLGGRIAAIREENDRAEEMLSAAYRKNPELDHHGAAYAEILAIKGRFHEALEVVEASLERFPTDEWLLRLRTDLLVSVTLDDGRST
jgi:tetratricopeptide (TPR) repeat protein